MLRRGTTPRCPSTVRGSTPQIRGSPAVNPSVRRYSTPQQVQPQKPNGFPKKRLHYVPQNMDKLTPEQHDRIIQKIIQVEATNHERRPVEAQQSQPLAPTEDKHYYAKLATKSGFVVAGAAVAGPLGMCVGYLVGSAISDD